MIFQFYPSPRIKGFSLLELLIVISIMALLGAAGAGFYRNFVKNVEVESITKVLAGDLRTARSKAMIGEEGMKWGAHVVNSGAGSIQYYELFSTATNYAAGTVVSTTTLPFGVAFSNPAAGASKDIIFTRISGTTTPETITVVSEGSTKSIVITSIGSIN